MLRAAVFIGMLCVMVLLLFTGCGLQDDPDELPDFWTEGATLLDSAPGVIVLRPADFVSGTAAAALESVAVGELVTLIVAHAGQDEAVDGFSYGLTVQGINGLETVLTTSAAPVDALFPGPAEPVAAAERGLRQRLQQEGVDAGFGALSDQPIGTCLAPYLNGSTQCEFHVLFPGSKPTSPQAAKVTATLQHTSANVLWFVEDGIAPVPSEAWEILAGEFEGVGWPATARYFGLPRDVDDNGRVIILLFDSRGLGSGGYVRGIDAYSNTVTCPQPGNSAVSCLHSNEADMLYLYADWDRRFAQAGSDLQDDLLGNLAPLLVHELKHLVGTHDETWLEEPSAVAASVLAGYDPPVRGAGSALSTPQEFRIVHRQLPDYGPDRTALYNFNFLFLWRLGERFGHDTFWRDWTQAPGKGATKLAEITGERFPELLLDWAVTLISAQNDLLDDYQYESLNLADGRWAPILQAPLVDSTGYTRSFAYYAGRGTGSDALISISSDYGQPYAVLIRTSAPD